MKSLIFQLQNTFFFQRSGIAIEMTKKTLSIGNFLSSQHDPT